MTESVKENAGMNRWMDGSFHLLGLAKNVASKRQGQTVVVLKNVKQ